MVVQKGCTLIQHSLQLGCQQWAFRSFIRFLLIYLACSSLLAILQVCAHFQTFGVDSRLSWIKVGRIFLLHWIGSLLAAPRLLVLGIVWMMRKICILSLWARVCTCRKNSHLLAFDYFLCFPNRPKNVLSFSVHLLCTKSCSLVCRYSLI